MPQELLTDRRVASATAKPGKRLEIWDAKQGGLCLRVTDRGVKTWVYRYRLADGRQPRYTIGKLPGISLKDARTRSAELAGAVAAGKDPAAKRRSERAFATSTLRTFNDLADLFIDRCRSGDWMPKNKRKRPRTLEDEVRVLRLHIRPTLGKTPYPAVTKADVRALLRKLTAKGVGAQANRTHALIRQVYNFAIAEDLVVISPVTGVTQPSTNNTRKRIWSDAELKAGWNALTHFDSVIDENGKHVPLTEIMALALKVTAVLGQRRQEIAGMRVDELDLPARTWTVPAWRMKGNRDHLVPLSDAAVVLIEKAIEVTNRGRNSESEFVFRTTWEEETPIEPNSMSRAMLRVTRGLGIPNATVHDLRRTMSTVMTSERLKVSHFIRSEVLAHLTSGGGAAVSTAHYDVNLYVSEKREALAKWSRLLMQIVGEDDPAMTGAPDPSEATAITDALMLRVAENPELRQAVIAELLGRSFKAA
ncbi:site-specific integrase [soil metagenome]